MLTFYRYLITLSEITEHHFKQLKKDNETKYFLTGLSSFNGTLRSIDHSSLEYIKKRFAADGIEYRRNGCYVLRVKMFDKGNNLRILLNKNIKKQLKTEK